MKFELISRDIVDISHIDIFTKRFLNFGIHSASLQPLKMTAALKL